MKYVKLKKVDPSLNKDKNLSIIDFSSSFVITDTSKIQTGENMKN